MAREVAVIFQEAPDSLRRRSSWPSSGPAGATSCLRPSTSSERGFPAETRFYGFPEAHWTRLRTTKGLERLRGEIKRRMKVAGALPDRAGALRLITAVALKVTTLWGERHYLDLSLLQTKEFAWAA